MTVIFTHVRILMHAFYKYARFLQQILRHDLCIDLQIKTYWHITSGKQVYQYLKSQSVGMGKLLDKFRKTKEQNSSKELTISMQIAKTLDQEYFLYR